MDNILTPDPGFMIWAIISFLILVFLLKTFAWGPLLGAVEEREARLRREGEGAEKARQEAERIQRDLEKRLTGAAEEAREVMAKAGKESEAMRARLKDEAEKESKSILDKTRAQLDEERRRVIGELRGEVAALSVKAAERLIAKSVDDQVQKSVLDQFFGELDSKAKKN